MTFEIELYNLLIRYAKDYQGKEVTLKELQQQDYYKCVWGHWRALAYYKLKGYYERLEDVPEGLESFTIMTDKLHTQYLKSGNVQVTDLETCRKFYGSVI